MLSMLFMYITAARDILIIILTFK